MVSEWPIAAEAADPPVEAARVRGGSRLATVRRDFLLDPAERLTEQERALMTAMLHDLVGTLATEIAAAANGQATSLPEPAELAARLNQAGLLDRAELVALLLRRADEHRIAAALSGRLGPRRLPLLPMLVADPNPDIAAAAMALVVARGRRRDTFGQPRVELSDLAAEDVPVLVNAVAAAIAGEGGSTAMAIAAATLVDRYNAADSLDSAVAALAEALDQAGRAEEGLIENAAEEGEAALLAYLLARRASIDPSIAWDHLIGARGGRLGLLAKMAGLGRQAAARLFAELGGLAGPFALEVEIGEFDRLTDEAVQSALAWWRLPETFRSAREALDWAHG